MSDEYTERRAEERGEIRACLKNIIEKVDKLDSKIDNLDCKQNTDTIRELKIDYEYRKSMKQHLVKTIITQTVKASGFVAAGATAVYAYFK